MFTTSQFLQIHKFEVGDTLEKTLSWYFYVGLQSLDWINFLPGFCKDTHRKFKTHTLPSLIAGESITEFSIFFLLTSIVLLPIYWKFGNFNPLLIIANPPPDTQKKTLAQNR